MGVWGLICALICPYDHPGPLVRFARGLNARTGCRYHEKLILIDSIKVPIFRAKPSKLWSMQFPKQRPYQPTKIQPAASSYRPNYTFYHALHPVWFMRSIHSWMIMFFENPSHISRVAFASLLFASLLIATLHLLGDSSWWHCS